MTRTPASPEARYAQLTQTFLSRPGVTCEGTGFGSGALKIGGKIFAMLSSRGEFVVKLPRQRVDALITSGDGDRYDPGHGRLMKEWLSVRSSSTQDWGSLADEALEFVHSRSGLAAS